VEDREIFFLVAFFFHFSLKAGRAFNRQPPSPGHCAFALPPPAAAMEFAVVEGESFSPSCPTLIMVRNPNAARYPRLLLESSF